MNALFERIVDRTGAYAPSLVGALVALVVGVIVAWIAASVARRAFLRTHLDEKIARWVRGSQDTRGIDSARWLARGVFWSIVLVALLVFFQVLGFTPITEPMTRALEAAIGFAPRLVAGGALGVLAFIVASFLRLVVARALAALRVDERLARRARDAVDDVTDPQAAPPRVAAALSHASYWLTWLLFLPGILSALELQGVLGPVESMVHGILGFLPNIATAALIVLAAFFVGRILAGLTANVLAALGADRLAERVGVTRAVTDARTALKVSARPFVASRAIGGAVHVLIVLFATMEAFDVIAFEHLAELMRGGIALLGHVALGLVVFAAGVGVASLAARAVRASSASGAGLLAGATRAAILVLAGAMALSQMGIANEIISLAFGLLLGGVAAAIAIAFGIGGREVAGRELDRWIQSARAKAAAARPAQEHVIQTH